MHKHPYPFPKVRRLVKSSFKDPRGSHGWYARNYILYLLNPVDRPYISFYTKLRDIDDTSMPIGLNRLPQLGIVDLYSLPDICVQHRYMYTDIVMGILFPAIEKSVTEYLSVVLRKYPELDCIIKCSRLVYNMSCIYDKYPEKLLEHLASDALTTLASQIWVERNS